MPSYFKTQWGRLLMALICLIMFIVYAFKPTDWTTPEGIQDSVGVAVGMVVWLLGCCIWGVMSFIDWHDKCVESIEKRLNTLEQRAITDIDKISYNNFMVRRRLGPDKNVPPAVVEYEDTVQKPKNIITVKVVKDGKTTELAVDADDADWNEIMETYL